MIFVYPGSFDPITNGHLDIIRRGAGLCGALVVAVLDNPAKKCLFDAGERAAMVREALAEEGIRAEVAEYGGFLADCAAGLGAVAILRGLRNPGDFAAEYPYAVCNRMLSGAAAETKTETETEIKTEVEIETVFLPCAPALSYISSSIVREAARLAFASGRGCAAVGQWVPANVARALAQKFSKG